MVSQHALQVSRPTPRERLRGLARRGSPGPHPGGRLRGLARGVSRPPPDADPPDVNPLPPGCRPPRCRCHGMTESVKVHRKDQSVKDFTSKCLFLLFWPISCISLIFLLEI